MLKEDQKRSQRISTGIACILTDLQNHFACLLHILDTPVRCEQVPELPNPAVLAEPLCVNSLRAKARLERGADFFETLGTSCEFRG